MVQTFVHPTAIVEKGAQLGEGVSIGPFCLVGPLATIQDGVELIAHATVLGATTIGAGTRVFPQAILGGPPQNTKHKGGPSTLVIGRNCIIREGVTMHVGTDSSRAETVVGDNGNFLAYAHVAHDCIVGRNVTFANQATLGGHCEIGNNVNIGGLAAVHQNVRIGDNAFIGGLAVVLGDIIPFAVATGNPAKLRGLNVVGLRRSGAARAEIHELRRVYRTIFDARSPLSENLKAAAATFRDSAGASQIINFLTQKGKRHLTVPRIGGGDAVDDED